MERKYDRHSLGCSFGLCNHSEILIQASALSLSQWVSNHFPSSLRNIYMISTNALKCRGDWCLDCMHNTSSHASCVGRPRHCIQSSCSRTSDRNCCQTLVRWQYTLCGNMESKNAHHALHVRACSPRSIALPLLKSKFKHELCRKGYVIDGGRVTPCCSSKQCTGPIS